MPGRSFEGKIFPVATKFAEFQDFNLFFQVFFDTKMKMRKKIGKKKKLKTGKNLHEDLKFFFVADVLLYGRNLRKKIRTCLIIKKIITMTSKNNTGREKYIFEMQGLILKKFANKLHF